MSTYDPRSIANTVLSLAQEYSLPVTPLSLQKILYFVHGRYLTETGNPLLSGYFEGWRYGPVHPLIYSTFKHCGGDNISGRATIRDLISGHETIVTEPEDQRIRLFIRETAVRYLKMTAGRLVDLSHAPRSPWDKVTANIDGERRFGMRMSNEDIRDLFKHHKISVGANPRVGEPNEESPPAGN